MFIVYFISLQYLLALAYYLYSSIFICHLIHYTPSYCQLY